MAAYLVFISHYSYVFDDNLPHALQRFFQEFHIGVTIFFTLSGFLIAYRYYDNFKLTSNWFKQYLKNRVARIYPMYFLLTIGAFVYYFFTGDQAITKGFYSPVALLLMHITFVRGFFYQLWDTGIAQGWSLTVEECFYFSAPFIFLIAKKYHKFYIQPLVITLTGCLLVLIFSHVNWYGFFGNFTYMMVYTFFGRCFEFFVGIQLALVVKKKGMKAVSRIKLTYIGFVFIFFCIWMMSVLAIPVGWTAGLHNPFGIAINNYLLPLAIATFFYGLLSEGTLLKKVLANPFVELLGKSSYIFYLIHLGYIYNMFHAGIDLLNDQVFKLYDKWGLEWHSPFENDKVNLLLAFIALNALSIALFKLIEEPLNHYIRKSDFLIKNTPRNPDNEASGIKA